MNQRNGEIIVLFDGICELCNALVRFARPRMKPHRLRFAPLQSPEGVALLRRFGLNPDELNSVVLIDGDRCCTHSDAAIGLLRRLRFPWPMLAALNIVPRPLRQAVYNWIARHRYGWFGTTDACPLPDAPREHES